MGVCKMKRMAARDYVMFLGKLSQEKIDKITFEDWDKIYKEMVSLCPEKGHKKLAKTINFVFKKMVWKAASIKELLRTYDLAKNNSSEEKIILKKLSQFQDPGEWLKMFKMENLLHLNKKAFLYIEEKIKNLKDFP
jgi:hypothetical protein